ncbi:hypothetical protein ACFRMQ_11045 [Kitasatospora sp. NPDC056783]|uniref:hypothetical protein n=1 Tax=Kitasatospora sp. NPDC056783 TaxID=3345943 RepID=UPI0036737669
MTEVHRGWADWDLRSTSLRRSGKARRRIVSCPFEFVVARALLIVSSESTHAKAVNIC